MSKDTIRKKVGTFLEGIPKNNSAFKVEGQNRFYTTAVDQSINDKITVTNENLSLTGAVEAFLPMQMATVGSSSERISFTLLINPETWNHSKSNSYQPIYTRNGWLVQPWGPKQDTITSTGKTAGFIVPSYGYTNIANEMSFGYLNYLSLLSAYKNNGYEFGDWTQLQNTTRVIKMIRGVQISFDNNTYMGHFNNFTMDEDETFPFIYNYNFEFIISTLDAAEYEVRGHYLKLPVSDKDMVKGTEKDPKVTKLVADPVIKTQAVMPPQSPVDETTRRLWEQKTGLPWSDASKYTDGSFSKNLALRKLLLSKIWDKTTKSFVGDS